MSFLLFPLLFSLALVLIHSFFGYFVLRRGVIFVDLALAQWAALGYLVAHYFHVESSLFLFLSAYASSLVAASLLSVLTQVFKKGNEQEALIGILYIMASATAIALISSTGMDSHLLQEMFSGHLLFISKEEFISSSILYVVIALLALTFRSHFYEQKPSSSFIFYALFGLLVSSSVKLVGLLLVFSFLVIPIFTASFFFKVFKKQVFFAWVLGSLGTVLGLASSLVFNIPPSYCVILSLSSLCFLAIPFHFFKALKKN